MVLCNKEPLKTLTDTLGILSLWILQKFQQNNQMNKNNEPLTWALLQVWLDVGNFGGSAAFGFSSGLTEC